MGEPQILAVLDFEATCWDDDPKRDIVQEIIEFPIVLVDVASQSVVAEFRSYVKPTLHPKLSKFCTSLTGITQKQVDEALSFPELFDQVLDFMATYRLFGTSERKSEQTLRSFYWVTCGDWDLKSMLPLQLQNSGIPQDSRFSSWINIKHCFTKLYKKKAYGMSSMLEELDLELIGRHHSGLDDSRNIARIVIRMLKDGFKFNQKVQKRRVR